MFNKLMFMLKKKEQSDFVIPSEPKILSLVFKTHQNFATNLLPPFAAQSEVCRGLQRNGNFRGEYLPKMELSERVNGIFGIP